MENGTNHPAPSPETPPPEKPEKPQQSAAEAGPSRAKASRFSAILAEIAQDETRERVSVADIVAAMRDRAFGPLLILFALPNILPAPPGLSGFLAIPLFFLSAQLMLGRRPWLPEMIASRSVARSDFQTIIGRAVPWLARAEKMLSPRLSFLVQPPAEYVIGAVCLILSVLLALPIPFGNSLPSIAIIMFSLAILERDGVWVMLGAAMTLIASAWLFSMAFAVFQAGLLLFRSAFG